MSERRDINSRLQNWARRYQIIRHGDQVHDRRAFDPDDAQVLDRAMPQLPGLQRSLLWWCYVRNETVTDAAMVLGLANKPAVQFVDAFEYAQAAIESLVTSQKH